MKRFILIIAAALLVGCAQPAAPDPYVTIYLVGPSPVYGTGRGMVLKQVTVPQEIVEEVALEYYEESMTIKGSCVYVGAYAQPKTLKE